MGALRGAFTAVLGLVALETIVSTKGAAERTGGLLGDVAGIIDHALSPAVALIPDRSAGGGGTGTTVGDALAQAGGNLKTHQLPDGSTFHQAVGDPNNPSTYSPPYVTPPVTTRPTVPTTPPTNNGGKVSA